MSNVDRDKRKKQLELDLLEIAAEELIESAVTTGSWFQANLGHTLEKGSEHYWGVMRRYMIDCLTKPRLLTDEMLSVLCSDKIRTYRVNNSSFVKA